jgi:hypothetical protein
MCTTQYDCHKVIAAVALAGVEDELIGVDLSKSNTNRYVCL